MKNIVIAVIVGYVVWTALWLGGNAALFGEAAEVVGSGEKYTATGPLVGVIVLSIACSVAAGLVAAKIAKDRAKTAVMTTAILLLLTGIGVQSGVWSLMPTWYQLVFLALVVPVTLMGGRLGSGKASLA